jgi:hypothetical protein
MGGGPCIVRYAKSKITTLPAWLTDFRKLGELDLMGINQIDYGLELKKLVNLPRLTALLIDPDKIDDNVINLLIQLKQLKSLKIRATLSDEQVRKLTEAFPDCEVVTGIYAND